MVKAISFSERTRSRGAYGIVGREDIKIIFTTSTGSTVKETKQLEDSKVFIEVDENGRIISMIIKQRIEIRFI